MRHWRIGVWVLLLVTVFGSGALHAQELTIRIAGVSNYQVDIMHQLAGEFTAQTGIQVVVTTGEIGVQSTDRLLVEILGGVQPELVWMNRVTVPALAALNLLQPLEPLLDGSPGLDPAEYIPGVLEEGTYQGQVYALPIIVDLFGQVWHKPLLQEAGYDPEQPAGTWEDLRSMARRLTRVDGDGAITQLGVTKNLFNARAWLYLQGAQLGVNFVEGDKVQLDDPRMVASLEWDLETADSLGGWSVISAFPANFARGEAAINPSVSDPIIEQVKAAANFEIGVGPSPAPENGTRKAYIGGWAVAIPTGIEGERLEAALAFMKWVLRPDNQVRRFQSSNLGFPAHVEALQQVAADLERTPTPDTKAIRDFLALAQYATPRGTSPINIDVLQGLERAANAALSGQITARDALAQESSLLQQLLDEFRRR